MESNQEVSFLDKSIRCKPRGLKQYKKRLVLSGESRYHPFKRNTKPKVCLSSSQRAVLANQDGTFGNSSESITVQQLPKTTVTAPCETRENLSCNLGEPSSLISESTPSAFLTQSSDIAQVACTLDSAEAYLLLLKAQNGISIFGSSGCVMVLKDYQPALNKLNPEKYVLMQRQALSFLHEDCHWVYWCSCDSTSSRQISSLNSNVNITVEELQRLYPDCIHIKAARIVYRKYDIDNGIEPLDESFEEQGADHRYMAAEEIFEVPDAKLLACRSGGSNRFGLVNKQLKCIICKKECEHSRLCKDVRQRGAESSFYELMENLLSAETDNESKREFSYKKAVISFKKIPYKRSETLCEGLKNLGNCTVLEDIILPDLDTCPNCHENLLSGDPVLEGWLAYENAVIVTNTSLKNAQVYYRPCQACGVAAVFEGQSKCLLNLGTYLVGYDVLRSYMHSFLHGRRPMYTFYQTWCDIHLDYGNSKIQEEFSYQKFRHAWHTFLSLLDIDYNEGFSCPDCGDDGPDTVICDGTSLSFQRRMWNWGDDSEESEKKLSSASFSDRIFLEDAVTRNLLKRFTADSVRGVKLKPLHELEKHKLLASLKQKSKPLFNIINEIDGDPALLPIYRKFLFSLASPSPVCSFIRPSESVESLIKAIVSGINIREEPLMWKSIHSSIPVVFEVFENQGFTDDMKLLLRELWNIAVLPFISAQEDVEKTTVTYHPDDELSFFPSLLKYRNRGHFEKDVSRVKRNEQCSKKYAGHPSLLPGVFTLFCPHGICYGFQVMASNESPNVPFTILRTRFKQAPRRVIYDNACKLQEYCLNRDPLFFKDTEFYVDRLHWDNHTSCSYGYNLSLYPELENLNSQCNEQANAGLKRIKDQLSYMTASNFMTHCAFYLRHKNMCKLKLYAFDEVITGEKISFAK